MHPDQMCKQPQLAPFNLMSKHFTLCPRLSPVSLLKGPNSTDYVRHLFLLVTKRNCVL